MSNQRTISYPFQVANGSVVATTDYQKIWQDRVMAAVGTAVGERPVDKIDYGTTLARTLWANQEEAAQIADEQIPIAFSKHLPYLDLVNVETYAVYEELIDAEYISIEVNYILPNGDDMTAEVIVGSINTVGDMNVYESYTLPAYNTTTPPDIEDE